MLIGDKLNISIISILFLNIIKLHLVQKGNWSQLKKMEVRLIGRVRKGGNQNCFRLSFKFSLGNRVRKMMVKENKNRF